MKVPNGRQSQVAVSHLGLGSNVQSSDLMINLLMIGRLSLGLNGRWPLGAGLNGHRPPETVGHLCPMQCDTDLIFVPNNKFNPVARTGVHRRRRQRMTDKA